MFSSFSAVATHEVKKEAAIMAYSVRQFYDCPILFVCDAETRKFLEERGIPGLEFSMITEERLESVRQEYAAIHAVNQFHRIDCIALKMQCLGEAVFNWGDTMFLDTDIILSRPIHECLNERDELILSPHYNYIDRAKNYRTYGVFNAGYIWTKARNAGDIWKEIYLHRSDFYEQQGMIWFLEHFQVGQFDEGHNIGFWRMPQISTQLQRTPTLDPSVVDWDNARSFHAHMIPDCYRNADFGLKRVYNQHREIVYGRLPKEIQQYIYDIQADT